MDSDMIEKVIAILAVIPIIILIWTYVVVSLDDTFLGGMLQGKIKRWSRKWDDNDADRYT